MVIEHSKLEAYSYLTGLSSCDQSGEVRKEIRTNDCNIQISHNCPIRLRSPHLAFPCCQQTVRLNLWSSYEGELFLPS